MTALPPGSRGLPWVGQFWSFVRDLRGFVHRGKARFGDIFRARVYLRDTIFVSTAEANLWVFKGEHDYLRKNWPLGWKRISGRHSQSVVTDKAQHSRQMALMRRVLDPTDEMLAVFVRITRENLARWASRPFVDPAVAVKRLALEIDWAALFGLELDEARSRFVLDEFAELAKGFSCLVPLDVRPCPFARAMDARRRIQAVIDDILAAVADPRHPRVPGKLLDAERERGVLGVAELKDQFQTMLFAGHEFPGAGIISACLELIQNSAIVARLRGELASLGERTLDLAAVDELPYLDAFVKEVLRMYPPVPGGYRELTRDVEFGGYRFPKGWIVKFEPLLSHFDERYWVEPQRFDPERFLPPREEDRQHRGAYIPFGGGRRTCPGGRYGTLLMKVFAAELVRSYEASFYGVPTFKSKFGHLYQPQFLMRLARRGDETPGASA